jgi:hypothetical protein
MTSAVVIDRLIDGWSDVEQAAFAARIRAETARTRSLKIECTGPLDLACTLNRRTVRTPALELVSAELERVVTTPGQRLMISMSPQEGKTSMIRHAVIRALQHYPDRRNVIASYALDLARTSGRAIRQMIDQFGTGAKDPGSAIPLPDRLGIAVAADHAAAADWSLRGHEGGLYCVGVGGGLTGRPIDGVLFVDDPVKGRAEASSPTFQVRSQEWWQAVSETRLAPTASVVIVMTRWDENDLVGWLLNSDTAGEWTVLNIPALADGQTADALNRPVGEWMVSARGRTVEQWERIRQRVGEFTFAALYQGRPAPVAGGIFKTDWFAMWRASEAPPGCLPPTVVVDPADNEGDGDEAGIIVATSHPSSGKVYLLDDLSARMTVARWARVALLTCARKQAPTLAYERSLSQLPRRIREAWQRLYQQATALRRAQGDLTAALARLTRPDDSAEVVEQIAVELTEIVDDVEGILAIPASGPRLKPIVARGSKELRMQLAAPMFEMGQAVFVGHLAQVEHQLATWQPGKASPDRSDATVHAVTLLGGAPAPTLERAEQRVPTRSVNRSARSRITRSTRR